MRSIKDGRVYGLSEARLQRLYRSAELIFNLHGGTVPPPEQAAETGRLVYLETDPVELQVELYDGCAKAIDFLEPHSAFFTWGLNYGSPDCRVPLPVGYSLRSQPAAGPDRRLDRPSPARGRRPSLPSATGSSGGATWCIDGVTYHWSKHFEFMKVSTSRAASELRSSLRCRATGTRTASCSNGMAGGCGRRARLLRRPRRLPRRTSSRRAGEFSVAKDQNVRLRSGWFSERSATYLAAGRPVVVQDTGFGSYLPTGEGLLTFTTMDDAAGALEDVATNYERHSRAASDIAREYLDAERVVGRMLEHLGASTGAAAAGLP